MGLLSPSLEDDEAPPPRKEQKRADRWNLRIQWALGLTSLVFLVLFVVYAARTGQCTSWDDPGPPPPLPLPPPPPPPLPLPPPPTPSMPAWMGTYTASAKTYVHGCCGDVPDGTIFHAPPNTNHDTANAINVYMCHMCTEDKLERGAGDRYLDGLNDETDYTDDRVPSLDPYENGRVSSVLIWNGATFITLKAECPTGFTPVWPGYWSGVYFYAYDLSVACIREGYTPYS